MKKGRKIILAATTALLGLASLVGCGPQGGSENTIVLWTTFNDTYQAIIEKAIKSFEEKYPEYKVQNVKQNGSYDDLKSMVVKGVSSNDYPDLVAAYPDSVADFIMTGKSLDITPWMESKELDAHGNQIGWTDEDIDDIPENYIAEGKNYFVPGTYSLPICKSTEAMYYNRDVLIGLDLSTINDEINDGNPIDDEYIQNLTWDELFDNLCPAIMEYNDALPADQKILKPAADYKDTWALVGYDSDDNLFITLAEQYGLGYTSLNQATGIGSVDFVEKTNGAFSGVSEDWMNITKKFVDAYQKKYFTTKGVIGKNVNYVSTTGGMLFSIGSTGGVKYQFSATNPIDVGVARIPQVDHDNAKLINQGPSIAFMKRGSTPEVMNNRARGAWLLYKEWSSTEFNVEWATNTGYAPLRKSVSNSPSYIAYSSEEGKEVKTADMLTARNAKYVAQNIDNLYSSPVFSGSNKARNAVSGILADIFKNSVKNGSPISTTELETLIEQKFQAGFNNAI